MRGPKLWGDADVGQVSWAKAVERYSGVCVATGNNLGKSVFTSQILIPWWLLTRQNSLVVVTAPSQGLIANTMWAGIRRAFQGYYFEGRRHGPVVPIDAKISSGMASPATVELPAPWNSKALGLSTTSIERLSGLHNPNLLVVCEESSGLEDFVFDALAGLGYCKIFLAGNPLTQHCGFHSRFFVRGELDARLNLPPEDSIKSIRTPSTASPHANLKKSPWGIADKSFLDNSERMYGKNSLWYRSHILAEWPTTDHESVFDPAWLARATSPEAEAAATEARKQGKAGRVRIAIDVSRGVGAARTVLVVRDDYGILRIVASRNLGVHETADKLGELMEEYNINSSEYVSYDAGGDVGRDFGKALQSKGILAAIPYFGGGTSGKWSRQYTNQRTASTYAMARRLDPEGLTLGVPKGAYFHIPNFPETGLLIEELTGLRGGMKGDKMALESKEDFAERLKRSPDLIDAASQSFWIAALQ